MDMCRALQGLLPYTPVLFASTRDDLPHAVVKKEGDEMLDFIEETLRSNAEGQLALREAAAMRAGR